MCRFIVLCKIDTVHCECRQVKHRCKLINDVLESKGQCTTLVYRTERAVRSYIGCKAHALQQSIVSCYESNLVATIIYNCSSLKVSAIDVILSLQYGSVRLQLFCKIIATYIEVEIYATS